MPSSSLTRRRFHLSTAAAAASLALPSLAQNAWPTRPIRIVVPYTPGGFTDQMARLVQLGLQQRLGQPVLIDNRPGANSLIGVDAVAKAAPDGSTFGVVIAAYAANTSLYAGKLPYDPRKDLMGVSLMGVSPLLAAVSNDAPFKTGRQLIDYARANPGKISFGSSGNGSAAHLTTELWKALTKTYMVHVPYRGAVPALTDLMGGQIQLFFDAPTGLINQARAGKIRLIGVAGEQRLPAVPDVPTFIEQGFAGHLGRHARTGGHATRHRAAHGGRGRAHHQERRDARQARCHGHLSGGQHTAGVRCLHRRGNHQMGTGDQDRRREGRVNGPGNLALTSTRRASRGSPRA